MRLIAFVLAAAVAGIVSGAAVAQGQWREHGYANQGFGIAWPAEPFTTMKTLGQPSSARSSATISSRAR